MESQDQRPFTTAGLAAIIGLVSLALFAVTACESGASLNSALLAGFRLGCLMIALGAVISFKRASYALGATIFALMGWPCVWPVLNSIAADGQDNYAGPLDFQPRALINSDWLMWGLETAIGILFVFICVRQRVRTAQHPSSRRLPPQADLPFASDE